MSNRGIRGWPQNLPAVTAADAGRENRLVEPRVSGLFRLDIHRFNVFDLTLTGNTSFEVYAPPEDPASSFTLVARQDGTGSRTITWWSGLWWSGGTAPTISTTASRIDVFTFLWLGTNWGGFTGGIGMR